jgi:anthranilate synthase component 1
MESFFHPEICGDALMLANKLFQPPPGLIEEEDRPLNHASNVVVRELPADLETPVSVYLKLAGSEPSFLLESVTGGEQLARYSFIGIQPSRAYVFRSGLFETHFLQGKRDIIVQALPEGQDPLDILKKVLANNPAANISGLPPGISLPPLSGGLVGYLSYELTRYFEPSLRLSPRSDLPEALFLLADTLVVFDHAFGRLLLIGNPRLEEPGDTEVNARLDEIERRLARTLPCQPTSPQRRQAS